jgi:hypothetical protein
VQVAVLARARLSALVAMSGRCHDHPEPDQERDNDYGNAAHENRSNAHPLEATSRDLSQAKRGSAVSQARERLHQCG